jgi:DNA primase
MAKISNEFRETVRARADIVDIIGKRVSLKKAGNDFVGLCPFHDEGTPSFHVVPSKQFFHCFGCKAGGDVFEFIKLREKVDFVEAVRILADEIGLPIPEDDEPGTNRPKGPPRKVQFQVLNESADFYHRQLLESAQAESARKYLDSRGIPREWWDEFQIGFAPKGAESLFTWAVRKKKWSQQLLIRVDLINRTADGARFFERFRGRLLFPIHNETGNVVGFSARRLPPDTFGGKYINTRETDLFHKGSVIFNLHRAKEAIAQSGQVIVCEGQIDAISLSMAGLRNVIAAQGTAWTETQTKMIQRHTRVLVLALDGDEAGLKAAHIIFPRLAHAELEVRIVTLPQGEDPGSFYQKNGPGALAGLFRQPLDFFDWQIRRLLEDSRTLSEPQRIQRINNILGYVAAIPNPLYRASLIDRLAPRLHQTRQAMEEQLARLMQNGPSPSAPFSHSFIRRKKVDLSPEELLLQAAMNSRQYAEMAALELGAGEIPDNGAGIALRELLERSLNVETEWSGSEWSHLMHGETGSAISKVLMQPVPGNWARAARDAIFALKRAAIEEKVDNLNRRLSSEQFSAEELTNILKQKRSLLDRLGILHKIHECAEE